MPEPSLLLLMVGVAALISVTIEAARTAYSLRATRGSAARHIPAAAGAVGPGVASKVLVIATRNGVVMGVLGDTHGVLGWSAADLIGGSIATALVPKASRVAHLEGMAAYRDTGHAPILGKTLTLEALDQQGQPRPVYLTVFGYETYTRLIYGLIEARQP
jgi:hypothetical protein